MSFSKSNPARFGSRPSLNCLLLVAAICVGLPDAGKSAEPEYQGASIPRWFARFCLEPPKEEVLQALRELGAPAVEYIVRVSLAPTNSPIFAELEAEAEKEFAGGTVDKVIDNLRAPFSKTPAKTRLNPAWVRENNAPGALAQLKPDADVLLPLLHRRLISSNPVDIENAFKLLGMVGTNANKVVPFVRNGLESPDATVRLAAAYAIQWGNIRSDALVRPLLSAMAKTATNRVAFGQALGRLGQDAEEAVPELIRLLDEKHPLPHYRLLIADAICRINPTHPKALSLLISALDDPQLRGQAWMILGEIKPRPDVPSEKLKAALRNPGLVSNSGILEALLALSTSKEDSIEALQLALNARNALVQIEAAHRLLKLDANNQTAIDLLMKHVRMAKIGGGVGTASVEALHALGKAGANASAVIPELEEFRNNAHKDLKKRLDATVEELRKATKRKD